MMVLLGRPQVYIGEYSIYPTVEELLVWCFAMEQRVSFVLGGGGGAGSNLLVCLLALIALIGGIKSRTIGIIRWNDNGRMALAYNSSNRRGFSAHFMQSVTFIHHQHTLYLCS